MGIRVGYINIYETGTVTVTSEETGYPKYRLYDRLLRRMWKSANTSNQILHVDQGASNIKDVSAVIIPEGHTLDGINLYWQCSDNDSDWTTKGSWVPVSGDDMLFKEISSAENHRYWRMSLQSLSVKAEVGEVFMTELKSYDTPDVGLTYGYRRNVKRRESPAGTPHYVVRGQRRRVTDFQLSNQDATALALLKSWENQWGGYKPFFFEDHESTPNQYFAELLEDVLFTQQAGPLVSVPIRALEVL